VVLGYSLIEWFANCPLFGMAHMQNVYGAGGFFNFKNNTVRHKD